MTDPTIRQKAEQAEYAAAERAREVDLNDWLQRLNALGKFPLLQQRLKLAKAHRWAGVIPTWKPVHLAGSSISETVDVIGIDGSQVYPQERNPVLWTYIQAVAYRKRVLKKSYVVVIFCDLDKNAPTRGGCPEFFNTLTLRYLP